MPEFFGEVVDGLNSGKIQQDEKILNHLFFMICIVGIMVYVSRIGLRYGIHGFSINVEAAIKKDMFDKSLRLSQTYYDKNKTGSIMALYTNDVSVIQRIMGQGTILFVDIFTKGGLAFYKLYLLNNALAIYIIVPVLGVIFVSLVIKQKLQKKYKVCQESYSKISAFTEENFSGLPTIKAFVKQKFQKKKFEGLNRDNYQKNISFIRMSVALETIIDFTLSFILAAILYIGSRLVLNNQLSIGELTKGTAYFMILVGPLLGISKYITLKSQSSASFERVKEFFDQPEEIKDCENAKSVELKGNIKIKDLSFTYPEGNIQVLSHVNLEIKKGDFVGIIGRTGSGKTTLLNLLVRTYNVPDGTIFFDDQDILDLKIKDIRKGIAYVSQDIFLFNKTVKDNIGFAYDKVDSKQINYGAKVSAVHEVINEFSEQYDTYIGERGTRLSGGQRQRIAIARAIIKDAPILILDGSLSAIDTHTEEVILSNIKENRKGKTTIIVSHRISTMINMDYVVVINHGCINGFGTHEKLLEISDEYKKLVYLQSLNPDIAGGDEDEN